MAHRLVAALRKTKQSRDVRILHNLGLMKNYINCNPPSPPLYCCRGTKKSNLLWQTTADNQCCWLHVKPTERYQEDLWFAIGCIAMFYTTAAVFIKGIKLYSFYCIKVTIRFTVIKNKVISMLTKKLLN